MEVGVGNAVGVGATACAAVVGVGVAAVVGGAVAAGAAGVGPTVGVTRT